MCEYSTRSPFCSLRCNNLRTLFSYRSSARVHELRALVFGFLFLAAIRTLSLSHLTAPSAGFSLVLADSRPNVDVSRSLSAEQVMKSRIAGGMIGKSFPRSAPDQTRHFTLIRDLPCEAGGALADVPSNDLGATALVLAAAGGAAAKPVSLSQEISASGPGP